jgi:chemotaxis protein CheZ
LPTGSLIIQPRGIDVVDQFQEIKEFFDSKFEDADDPRLLLFNDMMVFMEAIANNNVERADEAVQRIANIKAKGDLYHEVGRVTRILHDSIRGFKESIDPKIREFATGEMPTAVDKLQLIIESTEDAANKTIGIVDKYLMNLDTLDKHIKSLEASPEVIQYFQQFRDELENDMATILMTQSFQDLTGQTIKKVIRLVTDLEGELVKLVATFGVKAEGGGAKQAEPAPDQVSQADVDDLLKEFGF